MSIVRQNTAFETPEEKKIFWHTSAHIMAQAVLRLFPEAKFAIGPAIDSGFYYDIGKFRCTFFAQLRDQPAVFQHICLIHFTPPLFR